MPTDCVSYQESGYFSSLIVDYLNQKPVLQNLYNRFPEIENFNEQILEKQNNFNIDKRKVLVDALQKQYLGFEVSENTNQNISNLINANTFTVTTGHQLNLFTGPLYFLYKIISTINLCKDLKIQYPENDFVPIYWMATEDHDFDEINYFNFKNKKFQWLKDSKGPVGRLTTEGLNEFLEVFKNELGNNSNAEYIIDLFSDSYIKHSNLADATRFLANNLFGDYGLVILDGDSKTLKTEFVPYIIDELLHQNSNKKVIESIVSLQNYDIQVNPREINLFYIEDNLRARIIFEKGIYKINSTNIEFSEAEILALIDSNPEKFSPNVILRPLYQEVVLPNLCYIGGGGEIAYWLELKAMFDYHKVAFPILLLRNSVVLYSEKQKKKIEKLQLNWKQIFLKQHQLIDLKTKEYSEFNIDFSDQKEALKLQFDVLNKMALKTDKSFSGAIKAQEAKQIKGLVNLEKRLLKAEKRIYEEKLYQITQLQNELFPKQSLQERNANYSEFYVQFGNILITELLNKLKPLEQEFQIIILK